MSNRLNSFLNKKKFLELYKIKKYGLEAIDKYPSWFNGIDVPALARTIGDITSDGYLSTKLGIIQFLSKNKQTIIEFNSRIRKLFNVNPKIRRSPMNKHVWESIITNKPLCKLLYLCGTPDGNKTLKKLKVPLWVMNGDKETKRNYLKGLFNGEGSVNFQNNRRVRIQFDQCKDIELIDDLEDFMESIRILLSQFGIKTTNLIMYRGNKRKDGKNTKMLKFEIHGTRKNLKPIINYKKYIDFDDNKKKQKLSNSINKVLALQIKPR